MRWFFAGVAALVLLISGALSLDRFVDLDWKPAALAASFASYSLVGFVVALVLFALLMIRSSRLRRWFAGGAVLALAGVVLQAWLLGPFFAGKGAGTTTDLTVMTANLEFGAGDASTVVETATKRDVDVLVLEEVTPPELTRLKAAGLDSLFSESAGAAAPGPAGTMVFSTEPLTVLDPLTLANGGLAVTVGGDHPFTLLAVHTATPMQDVGRWRSDEHAVRDRADAEQKKGALLVVGDFNATYDHAAFRSVLDIGLSDATAQANSGWQPTWPTKYRRSWYRPALPLDHVLTTTQFSAVSTSTVSVPDTDHEALVVKLDRL